MSIPNITLKRIINYCGPKSYNRGREYLNTDALFIRYKDLTSLKAFCETISIDSYRLFVNFDSIGITYSKCTCKANASGPCEHIAALLLTWYYYPSSFKNKKEFAKNLKIKKKEDLVNLIEKMVDSYSQDKPNLSGISHGIN